MKRLIEYLYFRFVYEDEQTEITICEFDAYYIYQNREDFKAHGHRVDH